MRSRALAIAEKARLRIRDIYTTALADIFLQRGFAVVSLHAVISKRFALARVPAEEDGLLSLAQQNG